MGVRVITAAVLVYVFVAATSPHHASAADATCSKGDTPCWCKSIGGTWRALQAPLLPACKVTYQHQDAERYVHIYLPASYDGTTQWPVWVHLHGVFWATMGDIGARVGQPVNGTDIIPAFDHSVEILGDKAILVYPQSTGEAGNGTPDEGQGKKYRQFWSIPFWRCSVGICRDPSTDDMGFIEKVVADLPKRLPLKPGHYLLTGESAGGMMVHAILCQSRVIPGLVNAAIDMLGGVGADYVRGPKCGSHKPIPFLKLHGIEDPFITYSKDILVDGVNFASSIEGTQAHAKANGCGPKDAGKADVPEADGKMLCTDYCGGNPSKLPAKLCGMPGVGHDTDHPHPGFVYEQSWAWFQEQVKAAAGRKPAAAAAAGAEDDSTAVPAAEGPLELSITYPGAKVEDMKGDTAAAALTAVSQATGLPASHITATYTQAPAPPAAAAAYHKDAAPSAAKGGSRRLHRLLAAITAAPAAAAAAEGGVTGRYTLRTSDPTKVTAAVAASVQDGSLLQSLCKGGLAVAATAASSSSDVKGPLVSLSAPAAGGARQELIKPVDLTQAAAGATPAAAAAGEKPSPNNSNADAVASEIIKSAAAGSSGSSDGSSPPAVAAPAAEAAGQSPSVGVIVGMVIGGLAGAALLVAGALWLVNRRKQEQQRQLHQQHQQQQLQYQAEQAYIKCFEPQQQQQQQQRSGVINLTADAVMCINGDSVHKV